jgi:hypothetical protein
MADSYLASFRPRNEIEVDLVKTFSVAAWVRQRCVSAETCMTNEYIRQRLEEEELALTERVLDLGERLVFDSQGLWKLYPDPVAMSLPRSRRNEIPGGQDLPARLLNKLESTYAGCCWLLERWNELKILTLPGRSWRAYDTFRSIRLLGKQPLDVLDDVFGDLAVIFLATHELGRVGRACAPADAGRDARATHTNDRGPFDALRCEVSDEQIGAVLNRLRDRSVDQFAPSDEDDARHLLNIVVGREIDRLERLVLQRKKRSDADAAERIRRWAFDPRKEADMVRRYEDAAIRRMSRACNDFIKLRESGSLEADAAVGEGRHRCPDAHRPAPATIGRPLEFAIDGENGDSVDETFVDTPHFPPPAMGASGEVIAPSPENRPPGAHSKPPPPLAPPSQGGETDRAEADGKQNSPRRPDFITAASLFRATPTADSGSDGACRRTAGSVRNSDTKFRAFII